MNQYEPPTYAQVVHPMPFDLAEAKRLNLEYETWRNEHTRQWREVEASTGLKT